MLIGLIPSLCMQKSRQQKSSLNDAPEIGVCLASSSGWREVDLKRLHVFCMCLSERERERKGWGGGGTAAKLATLCEKLVWSRSSGSFQLHIASRCRRKAINKKWVPIRFQRRARSHFKVLICNVPMVHTAR